MLNHLHYRLYKLFIIHSMSHSTFHFIPSSPFYLHRTQKFGDFTIYVEADDSEVMLIIKFKNSLAKRIINLVVVGSKPVVIPTREMVDMKLTSVQPWVYIYHGVYMLHASDFV